MHVNCHTEYRTALPITIFDLCFLLLFLYSSVHFCRRVFVRNNSASHLRCHSHRIFSFVAFSIERIAGALFVDVILLCPVWHISDYFCLYNRYLWMAFRISKYQIPNTHPKKDTQRRRSLSIPSIIFFSYHSFIFLYFERPLAKLCE